MDKDVTLEDFFQQNFQSKLDSIFINEDQPKILITNQTLL